MSAPMRGGNSAATEVGPAAETAHLRPPPIPWRALPPGRLSEPPSWLVRVRPHRQGRADHDGPLAARAVRLPEPGRGGEGDAARRAVRAPRRDGRRRGRRRAQRRAGGEARRARGGCSRSASRRSSSTSPAWMAREYVSTFARALQLVMPPTGARAKQALWAEALSLVPPDGTPAPDGKPLSARQREALGRLPALGGRRPRRRCGGSRRAGSCGSARGGGGGRPSTSPSARAGRGRRSPTRSASRWTRSNAPATATGCCCTASRGRARPRSTSAPSRPSCGAGAGRSCSCPRSR